MSSWSWTSVAVSCDATCAVRSARRSRTAGSPRAPDCRRRGGWPRTCGCRAGSSRTRTTSSRRRAISRRSRARRHSWRASVRHRRSPTSPPVRPGPWTSSRRPRTWSCSPPGLDPRHGTRDARRSERGPRLRRPPRADRASPGAQRLPRPGPRRAHRTGADGHHPGIHPGARSRVAGAPRPRRDDDRLRGAVAADRLGHARGASGCGSWASRSIRTACGRTRWTGWPRPRSS